jgi:hypothetical protein
MALPVRTWADAECHLYLWSTNGTLAQVLELMRHWGVVPPGRTQQLQNWARDRVSMLASVPVAPHGPDQEWPGPSKADN